MAFQLLRPALLGQLCINTFLTPEECRRIIDGGERSLSLTPGVIEDNRANIRSSAVGWLSPEGEHQWLFQRIGDCINDINRTHFGYNLVGFEGIQFSKYSHAERATGDFYAAHKDSKLLPGGTIRKLSFTIQLCDSNSYEGGDVVLYDSFTDSAPLRKI